MKKILLFLSFLLMSIGMQCATATMIDGSNATAVTVNGKSGFKCGTGKAGGSMKIRVPSGASSISFYIGAWNGESPSVNITPTNKISITSLSPSSDSNFNGNSTTFTTNSAESIYYVIIVLNNITTQTDIQFSTSSKNKRFIVWGAEYETPAKYTVTFINELGKNPNNITQTSFGSVVNLPINVNICNKCYTENWEFYGWVTDKSSKLILPNTFIPTKDTILYALYSRKGIKDIEIEEYKLVSKDQDDWEGEYLIAYIDAMNNVLIADGRIGGGDNGSGGLMSSGTALNPSSNLTTDSTILLSYGNLYSITIEHLTETEYCIKTKDGKYNYCTATQKHASTNNITDALKYPISITFNNDKDIRLTVFENGGDLGHLQYNISTPGFFRFYTTTQNAITLFKRQKSYYSSPTEYSTSPECDTTYITTWNMDKIYLDKSLLNITDPQNITIKDINTDEVLLNNSTLSYNSDLDAYQVPINLSSKVCDKLNILIKNATDSLYMIYKVPFIVDADTYTTSMDDENCDVVVLPGKKLTVSGIDSEHRDVKLYAGAHLLVPNDTKYTINSLSFRKDNITPSTLELTGALNVNKLYFDLYVDAADWYWICLPSLFNLSNLKYVNGRTPIYKKDFWIRWYDGFGRALTQSDAWTNVDRNKEFLQGEGFIFHLNNNLKKKEFRFELLTDVINDEKINKNVSNLHAWGGDNSNLQPNHKGWNLVGNPFMNSVITDLAAPIREDSLIQILDGNGNWTGQWDLSNTARGKTLRYAIIPSKDPEDAQAGGYKSVVLDYIPLYPFTSFFVQIGGEDPETNQAIIFNAADRGSLMAPKRFNNERDEELFLRIKIGNKKTGCFISNHFNENYEPGDDLESRYAYYQLINGYKLLYSAINDSIIENGIQIHSLGGKVTLDPKVETEKFEQIYILYNNEWYDLLHGDEPEVSGDFVLYGKRKISEDIPTDIGNIKTGQGTYKFLHENNIFINNKGKIYNILGNKIY